MEIIITKSSKETRTLGELLAKEISGGPASTRPPRLGEAGGNCLSTRDGEIICLSGELGSGKTTFTQGLLKGLRARGPYTSPTFIVLKHYKRHLTFDKKHLTKPVKISSNVKGQVLNVYHIDAYRVTAKDILNLGWEEIVAEKNNVIIIEWADRIKKIIPKRSIWIKFKWLDQNKRELNFNNK